MAEASHCFMQNKACAYFPCHSDVAEEEFNCLFCYCPLYALGADCGGDFVALPSGVKSCEHCTRPHSPGAYERVMAHMDEVLGQVKQQMKHTGE